MVKIARNFIDCAGGSVFYECGRTKVICTASVEATVPPFLVHTGRGWLSSEYGMLPSSTDPRKHREGRRGPEGRTFEIQRLIGRSLRSVVDLDALGEITLWLDCDVIQADGGTRTASITGAYIALHDCLKRMESDGLLKKWPLCDSIAAVSVGIVNGTPVLDLDYAEDVEAAVDMNVIMRGDGRFVEIQGTAEHSPFTHDEMMEMLRLAQKGILELLKIQEDALR